MASASKDETVIVWNMERIRQNLGKMVGDPADFIINVIDDHEHVIDCIKFAPETAAKIIMKADYNKGFGGADQSNLEDSKEAEGRDKDMFDEDSMTKDMSMTNDEDNSRVDDESRMDVNKRLTAKEKVAKLKAQLEMKKKMLREKKYEDKDEDEKQEGEEEDGAQTAGDTSIQIDTSK